MFIKNKRDKGITLIALVVTIIVLLILAGISIQMLVGEGGILTNAREASDKTGRADVIEMARLDVLDEQASNQGILKESKFKDILARYFDYDTKTDIPDDLSKLTLTTKDGKYNDILASEIYSGILSNKNVLTAEELASQTKGAEDGSGEGSIIGKKVTGIETSEDLTDTYEWQIFDVDGGHIYLIATNYIPINDCPDKEEYKIYPHTTAYRNSMNYVINGYNRIRRYSRINAIFKFILV